MLKVQESVKSVTARSPRLNMAKAYIKTITSEGAKKINWDGLLHACELYTGRISADDADMDGVSMADVHELGLSFLTSSDRNLNISICLFVLINTFRHFLSLYYTFHACNRNIRK